MDVRLIDHLSSYSALTLNWNATMWILTSYLDTAINLECICYLLEIIRWEVTSVQYYSAYNILLFFSQITKLMHTLKQKVNESQSWYIFAYACFLRNQYKTRDKILQLKAMICMCHLTWLGSLVVSLPLPVRGWGKDIRNCNIKTPHLQVCSGLVVYRIQVSWN